MTTLRQETIETIWRAIDPSREGHARDAYERAKAAIEAMPLGTFSDEWQPIDTAPINRRVLVRVPIENHRLVIGFLTKERIWLDERMQPMPFVPTEWQDLPR